MTVFPVPTTNPAPIPVPRYPRALLFLPIVLSFALVPPANERNHADEDTPERTCANFARPVVLTGDDVRVARRGLQRRAL